MAPHKKTITMHMVMAPHELAITIHMVVATHKKGIDLHMVVATSLHQLCSRLYFQFVAMLRSNSESNR